MPQKIHRLFGWLFLTLCLVPAGFGQNPATRPATAPADNVTLRDEQGQIIAEAALQNLADRLTQTQPEAARLELLKAARVPAQAGLAQALVGQGIRLRTAGKAQQALGLLQFAESLARQIGDKVGLAYTLRFLGNHVFQSDRAQALAYYQQSLNLYEELDDKPGIAQMFYNIGEAQSARDVAAALESYQKSYALREALGDQTGAGLSLEKVALLHARQGNLTSALELYQKRLAQQEKLKDETGQARTLSSIGTIYRQQGTQDLAREYFQKSLAINERHGDKAVILVLQNQLGDTYRAESNYSLAAAAYQKALSLAEAQGNKPLQADLLYKIGNLYQAQHNYGVALVYHQKCLAIQEAANNKPGIAGALDVICGDQGMQGNTKAALESCQRSLALKESLGNKAGVAFTHNLIAWFHHHNGDYRAALEHYQRVLPQAESNKNWPVLAKALFDSGEAHERLGDLARAFEHYQKAHTQYMTIGIHDEAARALWGIGAIQLQQGQLAESLQTAERATALARQSNGYEALWRAHTLAGQALQRLNQLPAAQSAYEKAVAAVERMRNQLAGSEHERIRYLNERLKPWHNLVNILLAQGNISTAFDYTESAKARGLLDVMQNGHAVVTDAMTPTEQEQEQKINSALAALNSQILRESRQPKPEQALLTQLRERQQQTRAEREAFYSTLYAAHRELRELRGKALPLKLAEATQLLPNTTTALLNFLVTDDKTFLFVLSKDVRSGKVQAKTHTIHLSATDVAAQASQFRQLLARRDFEFQAAARQLYDTLLKPAAAQLAGKRLLVISPDAGLWELPFQALQSAPNRYLLENHAIAYVPSLSALRETMKLRQTHPARSSTSQLVLAVGNPALERTTIARAKSVLMDESLDPLPEAEQQVLALKQIYGATRSKILIGAEAREEVFKAEAPNYRILHLATHGVLNDASGIYSHLLLAQTANSSEANSSEDGLLEAWELIRMKLKADLVVLSACETARGKWGAGEGVIGMTGMLFVAGCPTVAVSQWKVEAASTARLMVDFHWQLKPRFANAKTSRGAAQSLQAAALKLLRSKEYRHPFYWAGFVVVGDGF